ncbi:DNA primase small subunit PriS [uncultured archaeon]|nr:DNA primase small subunit PriS [uncultured archaeon]
MGSGTKQPQILPVKSPAVPTTMQPQAAVSKETAWLRAQFANFYRSSVPVPSDLQRREFGFGINKKIEFRHKGFRDQGELQRYLVEEAPLFMSFSAARYRDPAGRPMERKGFLGSDLIFDLDKVYSGEPGHPAEEHHPVACAYCLNRSKQDALRLCDEFLFSDLGFSKNDAFLNFSGSKGFHVHIESDSVQQLSQDARRQLADFIGANELSSESFLSATFGEESIRKVGFHGPKKGEIGWKGRIHAFVRKRVAEISEGEVRAPPFELRGKDVIELHERRAELLDAVDRGLYAAFKSLEKITPALITQALQHYRVELDKQVTLDTGRLIRLQGSIHGDTGFLAKKLLWAQAASFEPLRDALAFPKLTETVAIVPSVSGSIVLGGQVMEYNEGTRQDAPMALAVLLVAKKKAVLAL